MILFTVLDPSAVLNCIGAQGYKGTIAMNEMTLDQNNEELLTYEVSDEVLEFAAWAERNKANTFTQWICTSAYFSLVLNGPRRMSDRCPLYLR